MATLMKMLCALQKRVSVWRRDAKRMRPETRLWNGDADANASVCQTESKRRTYVASHPEATVRKRMVTMQI